MKKLIGPVRVVHLVAVVAVAVVAALIAYGVGDSITGTYQASGTIRVALPPVNGVTDPNVTAEDDLATQYAQLVDSPPVKAATAKALNVPTSKLSLTGSTVSAQNILQVTASNSNGGAAQMQAHAATIAVASYLHQVTSAVGAQYLQSAASEAGTYMVPTAGSLKGSPQGSQIGIAKAGLLGQVVRDVTGGQPNFQIVDPGGSASETQPKPALYALIAFVVVLILASRIAFLAARPSED